MLCIIYLLHAFCICYPLLSSLCLTKLWLTCVEPWPLKYTYPFGSLQPFITIISSFGTYHHFQKIRQSNLIHLPLIWHILSTISHILTDVHHLKQIHATIYLLLKICQSPPTHQRIHTRNHTSSQGTIDHSWWPYRSHNSSSSPELRFDLIPALTGYVGNPT